VILLTLRADFYDRPMNHETLGKLLEGHNRSVLPMTLQDLRDVIEQPARLPDVRVEFEDGLVGDLLYEVRSQAGALPLLQFTLAQLFEKRAGHRLTLQAYRDLGGVRGALSKHAESVYEGLPSDQHRLLARALFLRLIEPGMTEQDTTRRRAALDELQLADATQTRLLNETASVFVNARLLVTDQIADMDAEVDADVETIEVSHEALIREWTRLANWLRDAREDVRVQKKINADVSEWERQANNNDLLYRGRVLCEALDWAAHNFPSLDESAFLDASAEEERIVEARELQRIADLRLAEETAKQEQADANNAQTIARQESDRSERSAKRANRLRTIAGAVGFLAALIAVVAFMTVVTANTQVNDANATLTPIAGTLVSAAEQVAGVRPTLARAETQVAGVQPTLDQAETQIAGVQPTLDQAETQIAGVAPTLAVAQVRLNQAEAQIGTATIEQGNALRDSALAQTEVAESIRLASGAQTQAAAAERTLTPIPATLTPIAQTLIAAEARVAGVAPTLAAAATRVAGVAPTISSAETQIAGVQPTLNAAETQVAGVAPTLARAETQIAGVAPTLEEARAQVAAANAALTPIALTLTPAQLTLQAADAFAAAAQREVIAFGQTLTPIPLTLAYSQEQIAQAQQDIQRANDAAAVAAQQATAAYDTVLEARAQVAAANETLTPIPLTLTPAQLTLQAADAFAAAAQREVIAFGQTLTPIPLTLAYSQEQIAQAQQDIQRANNAADAAALQATAANDSVLEARAQVADANATLTPIPLTLTPAQLTLQAADAFAAAAQREVIAFGQTLTPIPLTLAFSEGQIVQAQQDISRANAAADAAALQATAANDAVQEARTEIANANATLLPIPLTLTPVPLTLTPIAGTLAAAETRVAGVQPTLDEAATQIAGVAPTLDRAGTQIAEVNPTLTGVAVEIAAQQQIADALRIAAAAEQLRDSGNPDVSLSLALKAYELSDNLPQVQRVLNTLRPYTPRYLTSIDASNRLSALVSPQSISYIAFSPDGRTIAISEGAGKVIVRDLSSRRILFTLDAGERASVVRYSPGGKYVAVGTSRGGVVFESETGFERMRLPNGTITALAFSGDERFLIAGKSSGGAEVWDIEARAKQFDMNAVPTNSDVRLSAIRDVAFSENASQAYAYDGTQLNIAEMSGARVRYALVGNIRGVSAGMTYGVDGGQGDSFVTLWNPISYLAVREFHLGNFDNDYLETITFSRDRRYVMVHVETRDYRDTTRNIYAVVGRRVEYWRIEDGSLVSVMQTPALSPIVWDVSAMAISDDGRYGITGGYYGAVSSSSVWDLQTGEELRRFEGHTSPVLAAGFSPSSNSVYTISQDSVRVWDLGDPRSLAQARLSTIAREIAGMRFSRDQSELFLAYDDLALGRWFLGTQLQDTNRRLQTGDQVAVGFSPTEPLALVASVDSVTLWDMNTSEYRYRLPDIAAEDVRAIRFSDDGQFIYFLERANLWQWNIAARTGSRVTGVNAASRFAIDSLNEFALTASESAIGLTDMIDRTSSLNFSGYEGDVLAIDLSGGADSVIAGIGEPENAVMIWDARTGVRRFDLRAHTQPVTAVAFSPDGLLAVSGSLDTALILWDVPTGQVLRTFRGHSAPIREIVFAPDGRTFATRSDNIDDGVLFWRAETGGETIDWMFNNRHITELTCDQRTQFNIRPACEGGVAPTSTPSLTPMPTAGPTATFTPRPTATITLTPLPRARVIATDTIRLRRGFEGEAYTYIDGNAAPNETVTILESRQDIGWVKVRTADGEIGWTRLEFLDR